jgi:hypothetical protein
MLILDQRSYSQRNESSDYTAEDEGPDLPF